MMNLPVKNVLLVFVVWVASGALAIAQPNILANPDFEADPEGTVTAEARM